MMSIKESSTKFFHVYNSDIRSICLKYHFFFNFVIWGLSCVWCCIVVSWAGFCLLCEYEKRGWSGRRSWRLRWGRRRKGATCSAVGGCGTTHGRRTRNRIVRTYSRSWPVKNMGAPTRATANGGGSLMDVIFPSNPSLLHSSFSSFLLFENSVFFFFQLKKKLSCVSLSSYFMVG